jgi:hypothetical protein
MGVSIESAGCGLQKGVWRNTQMSQFAAVCRSSATHAPPIERGLAEGRPLSHSIYFNPIRVDSGSPMYYTNAITGLWSSRAQQLIPARRCWRVRSVYSGRLSLRFGMPR